MNSINLFPTRFKKIGWMIFVPASILGIFSLFSGYEPAALVLNVPSFFIDELFKTSKFFGFVENNIFNELIGILIIVGGLFVAFSRETDEDEFISKLRLDSLVWATYVNYGVLVISFLLVHDIAFYYVMLFNMFTILLFFIMRFNVRLHQFRKSV